LCAIGLGHLVGFAHQEFFEGFHILGKIVEDGFSGFMHKIQEVGTHCSGRVLLFEGAEEAGFDSIPAVLICSEGLQAVHPRLALALENACQLLDLLSVILGGNSSSNFDSLNELLSKGGVFGFIPVKQGQISRPLEAVMGCQGILKVGSIGLLWKGLNVLLGVHLEMVTSFATPFITG
jgi:hypothetical protein